MSSNKYLSAFLTSAAALGGLYLLDRFLGGTARENPKSRRYEHTRVFTDDEKYEIARRYHSGESSVSLARDFETYIEKIQEILEETNTERRDRTEALRLGQLINIPEDIKRQIRARYNQEAGGTKPLLNTLVKEFPGYSQDVIRRFLIEEKLYEISRTQELFLDDQEKILRAKEKADAAGEYFSLNNIGERLDLIHQNVSHMVVLRFLASHKKNKASDYSGRLSVEQQNKIMSYFPNGEQVKSIREISSLTGITESQIYLLITYHNIVPIPTSEYHKRYLSEDEKNRIIDLYKDGLNSSKISSDTGITKKRVDDTINEYRAQAGSVLPRLAEIKLSRHDKLMSRSPQVVSYIVQAREKPSPDSYEKIKDDLNINIPKIRGFEDFSISRQTVANIYADYLASKKK